MALSAAAQRNLDTVLELLAAGDAYGAQQKIRTSAARLLSTRNGPAVTTYDAKAQDAAGLLFEGARKLLENGQVGSGVDLALYLVEVWAARSVECGAEQRGQLCVLWRSRSRD